MSAVASTNLPEYFRDDFFNDLRVLQNKKAKILSTKPATKNGDNFASCIYRTKVQFDDNKQKTLIVKSLPEGQFSGEFAKKFNTFPKESETYLKVITELEKIFDMYGEEISFAPM